LLEATRRNEYISPVRDKIAFVTRTTAKSGQRRAQYYKCQQIKVDFGLSMLDPEVSMILITIT